MRVDAAITRLQTAVQRLNSTARETESAGGSNIVNLSGFYGTPPLCVGYFNISSHTTDSDDAHTSYPLQSSSSYPLQTEEFRFGEGRGILVHRVVVLAKDETLLDGSVVGRSHPSPSSLLQTGVLSAWCSDLLTVRGRLTPFIGQQRGDDVWLIPDAENAAQLVTDRIVIQSRFERLTVCIYGWPVDIEIDERFCAARRSEWMNYCCIDHFLNCCFIALLFLSDSDHQVF